MNRITKLALLAALALFLCACGQRGPLYLPEPAPSNKPAPKQPAPDESNSNELSSSGLSSSGLSSSGSISYEVPS